MDCAKIQEQMLDQMGHGEGTLSASPDLSAHMADCAECTKLWQAMQASSAALDEWTAPEPSPYFNTRFQARLAEVKREQAQPAGLMAGFTQSFRHSFWRPAVAGAMALAIAVGVGIYERPTANLDNGNQQAQQISPAVNDLQKLDKNEDMYADFEMLDDLQTSNSQPANATTTNPSKTEM
jgi:anti-sigma factor RsiW